MRHAPGPPRTLPRLCRLAALAALLAGGPAVAAGATVPATPGAQPVTAGGAAQAQRQQSPQAWRFALDPVLNDEVLGRLQVTHAAAQDTLTDIARRFSVGYEEIHRANPGVDMWLPGTGRRVLVPTQFVLPDAPHVGIVVNLAAMRLFYYLPQREQGQQVVYTFPIGIGRISWNTPAGTTTVVRKARDPVWRPPADILAEHLKDGDPLPPAIGPGPDDPMGSRALYLGWPEYAIHGTNKPAGVGMRVSHGCMHLYPEDIQRLFDQVPVGTPVRVVNQPYVFGWHQGELYLQAFGPLAGRQGQAPPVTRALLEQAMGPDLLRELRARNEQVDWDLALRLAAHPTGIAVSITAPGASLARALAQAVAVPDGADP